MPDLHAGAADTVEMLSGPGAQQSQAADTWARSCLAARWSTWALAWLICVTGKPLLQFIVNMQLFQGCGWWDCADSPGPFV
jgi:hypothetical protein